MGCGGSGIAVEVKGTRWTECREAEVERLLPMWRLMVVVEAEGRHGVDSGVRWSGDGWIGVMLGGTGRGGAG